MVTVFTVCILSSISHVHVSIIHKDISHLEHRLCGWRRIQINISGITHKRQKIKYVLYRSKYNGLHRLGLHNFILPLSSFFGGSKFGTTRFSVAFSVAWISSWRRPVSPHNAEYIT